MSKSTMKYITILDFSTGTVYQKSIKGWNITDESCEEYINRIGLDSNSCQWMVHSQGGVEFDI